MHQRWATPIERKKTPTEPNENAMPDEQNIERQIVHDNKYLDQINVDHEQESKN
jgi:hypothetical protein